MPSARGFSVSCYKHAKSLPDNVFNALEENRVDANVILPFLKKGTNERSNSYPSFSSEQLWVCCVNYTGKVEIVLSCTTNVIGGYPIFIVSAQPVSLWKRDSLEARLLRLAEALVKSVPVDRVYSVFAPDTIVKLFSQQWSKLTNIPVTHCYYEARLLSCTAATLTSSSSTSSVFGISRPVVAADLHDIARICLQFSEESEPFVLNSQNAMKEAEYLVSRNYAWVHCVDVWTNGKCKSEVACIAAFTRNTAEIATISKVYTDPHWRSRGFAKTLVRKVSEYLLRDTGRQKVVLYVAHANESAARVYESVGFVEPDASVQSGHSLNWTELGFDKSQVTLGHW
ncbi:hypothetical protein D9757_006138 [Collybiopsis confluens]|uniref:N-acetyltransferase domain-containing protein n=1 Tax=Collybiopsis confluens TaxID=2823264 RepID=A0A8H5M7G0_9AGAR|nr:hypothetical protein D9757_006138 [Collybiopsis confluens]